MSKKAFQDNWEHNECWGCGCSNEHGLYIKSYWVEDKSVCTWMPNKSHKAGPTGYLNGGVIATIMDCHSICTAIADGSTAITVGDRWRPDAALPQRILPIECAR